MKPFRGEIKTAMIKIEIESVDPLEFVKAMGEIHACLSHAGQPKPDMVILP